MSDHIEEDKLFRTIFVDASKDAIAVVHATNPLVWAIRMSTTNIAEYEAVVKGLVYASSLKIKNPIIASDSQLVIRQLNGIYRVKNPMLRVWYDDAKHFQKILNAIFTWIPREQNPAGHLLEKRKRDNKRQSRVH